MIFRKGLLYHMKLTGSKIIAKKTASQRGFTLIEMAMVIAILAIVSAFAFISYNGTTETRDAAVVQSVQVTLQQVISQASGRYDINPTALDSADVVNAVEGYMIDTTGGNNIVFAATGGGYRMSITGSGRGGNYSVNSSGDVTLDSPLIGSWEHYGVQNGIIKKQ